MKYITVSEFGPPEVLKVEEVETPAPGPGQVRIAVTSIGMNHAELMQRDGSYKLLSGDPPFTPGLEAGGVIEAVGDDVTSRKVGDRVILDAGAPRDTGGAYRSHIVCDEAQAIPAPPEVPDEQLGAIWLPYLTAWGCLVWRQDIGPDDVVAIPAASSSVGLAAAQVVKHAGGTAIGLTSSPAKVDQLNRLDTSVFDHLVVTHDADRNLLPFNKEIKDLTDGNGATVFFDPVASGKYFDLEMSALADGGTIWIYGLLGEPDTINIHTLIRKRGAVRGWMLYEILTAGDDAIREAYDAILGNFADGVYRQHVSNTFKLDDVVEAHRALEKGSHIGKWVLVP